MQLQKISILTPSYNQGNYLERNILSILNQNYPSFEHIVIDGGSVDNTIEVLKKYPHLKWVSERDGGQSDALNKGLKMATGEIIGWINSDDFYAADIFNVVAKEFEDPGVDWIIGNINIFDEQSKNEIPIKSPTITFKNLLKNPDIVKQQATFFRKSVIEQAGAWDPSLHMVMDYDLWLRLAKIGTPKMVDKYWAYFTFQAEQKSLGLNLLLQSREMRRVMKREGAGLYYRLKIFIKKYFSFIKFLIKSALITIGLIPAKYRRLNFINRTNHY
jgi:glycosyltransferase involved in cell wall biosynthesis